MNNCFLLLLMIFLHIVDDYYLQGILASMKQKEWWNKAAFTGVISAKQLDILGVYMKSKIERS